VKCEISKIRKNEKECKMSITTIVARVSNAETKWKEQNAL